jgi:NAD(P)-dependent dehydrogenase (short-subunit alcohol dehydrogenase family)
MNRIAVVTGANRGIGREVARQLADAGDIVYLTARNLADADTAVADLGSPPNLHSHQLDVTDPGSIDRLAVTIEADHHRLDILINNAAILYDTWQPARTADLGVVREALETNLFGAWAGHARVSPAAAPEWIRADCECLQRSRVADIHARRHPRVRHLEGGAQCTHPDARRRIARRPHPRQRSRPWLSRHRHGWPRWRAGRRWSGRHRLGRRPA